MQKRNRSSLVAIMLKATQPLFSRCLCIMAQSRNKCVPSPNMLFTTNNIYDMSIYTAIEMAQFRIRKSKATVRHYISVVKRGSNSAGLSSSILFRLLYTTQPPFFLSLPHPRLCYLCIYVYENIYCCATVDLGRHGEES